MEDNNLKITSTAERLQMLISTNKDYSVFTDVIYIDSQVGFLVKTKLIIGDNTYEGNSFRKINPLLKYTALETADTVSLGRALGKAGFGINDSFSSLDEIDSNETPIDLSSLTKVSDTNTLKPPVKGSKAVSKNPLQVGDKTVYVDKEEPLSHGKAIEAKLASLNGDFERANKIVNDAKATLGYEPPQIPELIDSKRDVSSAGFKQLVSDLSELGATTAGMLEYSKSISLKTPHEVPQGIHLLIYGTIDQISNYIKTIIK